MLVIAATERELACATTAERTLVCGIGPVEAAIATTAALGASRPRRVLHFGLAGAAEFTGPELVVGSEALYCDAGSKLVPARAIPDAVMLSVARSVFPQSRVCAIGTSARLGGATGCEVEAMEGFAVLRACELAGVPALEVRAISNAIGELDRSRWQFDEAFDVLRATIPVLLEAFDGV